MRKGPKSLHLGKKPSTKMRSYELFKQYIWLVGTISRAGKISLEEINRRWYALVRHITRDSLFTLSFDRIIDIHITEESFRIAKDFDAQSWFSDCYGVFRNQDAELERVVVRAYGREAFYLRDLPFHHSQREIASGEDWTDFEYWLRISNDFYTPLLSRGPNIKVLQPQWLAYEIRQQLLKAAGLYE